MTPAANVASSSPSASSTTPAAAGSATASAATGASATATASPTTASDDSEATADATSPASATATREFSNPLNDTNDPHECHKSFEPDTYKNVFCKPVDGQVVLTDHDYKVTWDPDLYPANSTNTISLSTLTSSTDSASANLTAVNTTTVPNSIGAVILHMSASYLLPSTNSTNLTLFIRNSIQEEDSGHPGPTITLVASNDTDTSSSPSHANSSDKKLGEKVGLPIGLIFFLVGVAFLALFFYMRRRRRGGYGAGSKAARSERMKAASTPPITNSAGKGHHRRGSSFHDEPTRGMELQDRVNSGGGVAGGDSWDWGSPVSSPTYAGGVGGGRGSNAFREEMQRQKGGRR